MEKRLELVIDSRPAEEGAKRITAALTGVTTTARSTTAAMAAISGVNNRASQATDALTGSSSKSNSVMSEQEKISRALARETEKSVAMKGEEYKALVKLREANASVTAGYKTQKQAISEQQKISSALVSSKQKLIAMNSEEYRELLKTKAAMKALNAEYALGDKAAKRTSSSTDRLTKSFSGLAFVLGGIGAGMMTRELVSVVDTYSSWQNKLAVVTDGTVDLKQATRDLLEVSLDSRVGMNETMDLYSKLTRVNQEYGKSQQELLQITTTVNQAVSMSGASVGAASGAALQFAQALSGNFKAVSQELNSMIEGTPALAALVAEAVGSTTAKIKKLAEAGLVETRTVLDGITRLGPKYAKRFQQASLTIGQSTLGLKEALMLYVGEIDKAGGYSEKFATSIQEVARNIGSYDKEIRLVAAAVGTLFTGAVVAAGAFVVSFAPIAALVVGVTTAVTVGATAFYNYAESISAAGSNADNNRPYIESLALAWKDLIDTVTGTKADNIFEQSVVGAMTMGRSKLEEELGKVGELVEKYKVQQQRFTGLDETSGLSGTFEGFSGKADAAGAKVTQLQERLNILSEALKRSSKNTNSASLVIEDNSKKLQDSKLALASLNDEIADPAKAKAWKEYYANVKAIGEAGGTAAQQSVVLKTAWGSLQDKLDKLDTKAMKPLIKTQSELESKFDAIVNKARPLEAVSKDLGEAYGVISQMAKGLGKDQAWVNSMFVDYANAAMGATKESKDFNKELKKSETFYNDLLKSINPVSEANAKYSEAEAMLKLRVDHANMSLAERNALLKELSINLGLSNDWTDVAAKGFKDYAYDAVNATDEILAATTSGLKGMEDALVGFVTTGKLEFGDLVNSILADIARITIRQSITGPLSGALGDILKGIGGMFTPTSVGGTGAVGQGGGIGLAKGGAFDHGVRAFAKGGVPSLNDFSNSIVDKPTKFAAGGSFNNLMGEAGAEAILPLTRTSSGNLGVESVGGSGDVNITIINETGTQIEQQQVSSKDNSTGGKDITIMITKTINEAIQSGATDRSMRSRYGASPVGA